MNKNIKIIGAGLAGCECAYQLASRGFFVELYEMRPQKSSPAHKTNEFGELVCSNSFRSNNIKTSAVGLMHKELESLNSLIIKTAYQHRVPAGDALAVDRIEFSKSLTKSISNHPNIKVITEEIINVKEMCKDGIVVIATGPLTSEGLSQNIREIVGEKELNFFDAIAPIIYKDSINFNYAWYQSRYDRDNSKDYINCGLNKEEYSIFYNELINAEYTTFEDFEKDIKHFEGCLPIEEMARRGEQTLLFGPMKPVGLVNPYTQEQPYAVVQLRQDNLQGTLYNMVGFQTKMKYNEQKRVLKLIKGLENAEFAKLGSIHKNMFINSPKLLNKDLSLKSNNNIYFAGQITGCEGYVESTAVGLIVALMISFRYQNKTLEIPNTLSIGAILNHITEAKADFQPSNINFGLFDHSIFEGKKKIKKQDKKDIIINKALLSINIFNQLVN